MSTIDPLAPELSPDDQIEFVASHHVALKAGDYEFEVTQTLSGGTITGKIPPAKTTFSVAGERFTLGPQAVHAVFPPENSRGNFEWDLPHIILNRSTLPWERSSDPAKKAAEAVPWLAVLLFREIEIQAMIDKGAAKDGTKQISMKASQLVSENVGIVQKDTRLVRELADHPEDVIRVIDIPSELQQQLGELLPTPETPDDFVLRTHVRRRLSLLGYHSDKTKAALQSILEDRKGPLAAQAVLVPLDESRPDVLPFHVVDHENHHIYEIWAPPDPSDGSPSGYRFYRVESESAVILGNRLPEPGKRNVAHLVSLEGLYVNGKKPTLANGNPVRLVSLKSWTFFCEAEEPDFKMLLTNLNSKSVEPSKTKDRDSLALQLPLTKNAGANEVLSTGRIPLRHHFSNGDQSVSWYRGPLVTEPVSKDPAGAIRSANELRRYDSTSKMFEVSYAAAWELGRMLMLRNRKTSLSLFRWKRGNAQAKRAAEAAIEPLRLPILQKEKPPVSSPEYPADVTKWLQELAMLHHIPFHYLVPDERMLPPESIRFFHVDPNWIECLNDGALSIGSVGYSGAFVPAPLNQLTNGLPTCGFFLRSEAVSGFPGLQVNGYDKVLKDPEISDPLKDKSKPKAVSILRMERLSTNLLLVLFSGDVQTFDIHLKPETLHFGFEKNMRKKERNATGEEFGADVSFVNCLNKNNGVIDFGKLKDSEFFEKQKVPQFALNMVAGVELVRFTVPSPSQKS